MACAANYAWANRQILMHRTREIFERTLGMGPRELGMRLLYDVCHNIAKIETLPVEGKEVRLCVHRKGATRAFPPGHRGPAAGLPEGGAAGPHPRGHGDGFLCPGGDAEGLHGNLREHLPRRRAGDEPDPGDEVLPGAVDSEGDGGAGRDRHGLRTGDAHGGDPRGQLLLLAELQGPSFSLMPHSQTILRARFVAR